MFNSLQERLESTLNKITGKARLTEKNIKEMLKEIRTALIEADVALPVVKSLVMHIREKAIGEKVIDNTSPGQTLVKLVRDELVHIMGDANDSLHLSGQPPQVILMAGLQGSGKTTSTAKLARKLKNENKKVLVASTDIYRAAAIEQLQTLAAEIGVHFFPSTINDDPIKIAKNALAHAKIQFIDTVIIDTAGRLHIDDEMMTEIKNIHAAVTPIETLFVVDSMTGQDAANTAKAFDDALPLTGVILTKTDGDSQGGAALSVRYITGKPIKFMGIGEKTDALQAFHPDRVASRLLGMGDILSLVEEAEQKIDKKQAEKMAKKIIQGKGFTLDDYKAQLEQMNQMGGISSMMDKLPGMGGKIPPAALKQMEGLNQHIVIINSMTRQERLFPSIIKNSRKRRISMGSGTSVQSINQLLKQFIKMQKMMKRFKGKGMGKMMDSMKGLLSGQNNSPFGE